MKRLRNIINQRWVRISATLLLATLLLISGFLVGQANSTVAKTEPTTVPTKCVGPGVEQLMIVYVDGMVYTTTIGPNSFCFTPHW